MKILFKRIVSIICIMSLCMTLTISSIYAQDDIKVVLNGQELSFDVQPQIIDGSTMVPMRKIFEELGYSIQWQEQNNSVIAWNTELDSIIILVINNPLMVNGSYSQLLRSPSVDDFAKTNWSKLDNAPQIIDGSTLVPVRAISEASGYNVQWDGNSKTVIIGEDNMSTSGNSIYYKEVPKLYSFENIAGAKELKKDSELVDQAETYKYFYVLPTDKDCFVAVRQYVNYLVKCGYKISKESQETDRLHYGLGSLNDKIVLTVIADKEANAVLIVFLQYGKTDIIGESDKTVSDSSIYYEEVPTLYSFENIAKTKETEKLGSGRTYTYFYDVKPSSTLAQKYMDYLLQHGYQLMDDKYGHFTFVNYSNRVMVLCDPSDELGTVIISFGKF